LQSFVQIKATHSGGGAPPMPSFDSKENVTSMSKSIVQTEINTGERIKAEPLLGVIFEP
jgi:hypothetical protein